MTLRLELAAAPELTASEGQLVQVLVSLATSAPGAGSTFRVELPAAAETARGAAPA